MVRHVQIQLNGLAFEPTTTRLFYLNLQQSRPPGPTVGFPYLVHCEPFDVHVTLHLLATTTRTTCRKDLSARLDQLVTLCILALQPAPWSIVIDEDIDAACVVISLCVSNTI